jgi:hypothetical protein
LDQITSTVPPGTVEPPEGKVTGQDGKKRAASSKPKKAAKPKPKDDTDTDGRLLDSLDNPVPPGLVPVFNKVRQFREIINQLNEINRTLQELHSGPAGSPGRLQQEQIDLGNLKESVHFDTPYCVCTVCSGNAKTRKANCPCKDRGWLLKAQYDRLSTEYRQ